MNSKDQLKDYVSGLKSEIHTLKQELGIETKLLHQSYNESDRLKKVCCDNGKLIISLEEMLRKTKKWYQIIIWQK